MLSKAKNKLSDYIAKKKVVEIKQGFLPKIPYEDNGYDAVIFMQVLHHVDTQESNFANLKATMKDAYRVLKPGGVLMINFCTGDQVKSCFSLPYPVIYSQRLFLLCTLLIC